MSQNNKSKEHLTAFLSSFPNLKKEEVTQLTELIPVISPAKGTILLKEGQLQKECYFVLQGMVRQYHFVDGTEHTTEFYTENNATVSAVHYSDQSPALFYLECMEDCLLIAGNLELDEDHFEKFPALLEITRHMIENDLNKTKTNFSKFITSSPKERYLHFAETRPDVLQKAPLYQIASYLGMTPESLSRIRKRIVTTSP